MHSIFTFLVSGTLLISSMIPTGIGQDDAGTAAAADAIAAKMASDGKFSGVLMIARDGKPIFTRSYGKADREKDLPNLTNTKFNLGSITKLFTALSVGILADESRLSLDDTIGKHLPDYPNKQAATEVTVRQLLAMTSGIGDVFGPEFDAAPKSGLDSIASYLPLFAAKPLEFAPGTNRRYSNGSYIVLGAIVEKVSGKSYYEFVQDRIFKPLEMEDSGWFESDSGASDIAKGYTRPEEGGKWVQNIGTLPRKGSSAGGSYSTAADLLKFANALDSGTLKVPESLAKADGIGTAQMLVSGLRMGGGAPGINGIIESRIPGGYTVVALANQDPPSAMNLAKEIRELLKK